ncbi:beta-lactamase family protein [Alteromonas sp. 5E99-2]|uniref:serine hydrolase domain-containing protein n=1 Tax=Alteromonas sp. 5E99-2 TaxID=2817683 RepID=UPI001A99A0D2|nr:serine hydrolase domain-containing protein [Alteromonas sp. 5E99-2]MBO1256735.1 beta-lactamase family protein [Alteromonas sp. 5E99-2]
MKFILYIVLFITSYKAMAESYYTDNVLETNVPILMKKYYVPGMVVGILEEGKVAKYYYFGYSDLTTKQKVNKHTAFNLGSISKSVTAWGVMKLVEKGKIELDTPIQNYITRWQIPSSPYNPSGVTVRRLLNHTSGLSQHAVPQYELNENVPSIEVSLSESANLGGEKVRLIYEPGEKWSYSGGGYTLLQLLIEEITGLPFSTYMEKEILHPLGMFNSSFEPNLELLEKLAKSYDRNGQETGRLKFAATGSAGLQSTPQDLAIFANAALTLSNNLVAGRGVLKPQTVSTMTSISSNAKLPDGKLAHRNYGLGYFVTSKKPLFFGHGGDNRGWHSRFIVYPKTKNGIVILTNSSNGFWMAENLNCLLAKVLSDDNGEKCV